MKKQCIISICLAVLIALNTALWVSAEGIEVELNNMTEVFTVSGTVEEATKSGKVSLLVISDNGDIAHAASVRTNEDGSFTYSFKMDSDVPSGGYTAYVSAFGREGQQPFEDLFDEYYVSSTRKNTILDDINNNMADVPDLKDYLTADTEKVMKEVGLVWPKSLSLSQTAKDKIYADIFAGRTYAELKDLKELFYNNVSIYALNEATSENIVAVWNEYNTCYDTSTALMDGIYQNYSTADKNEAVKRMATRPVTGQADLIKNFNAAVFLQEIYLCSSYSDVNSLFAGSYEVGTGESKVTKYYKDAVTFDLTRFNSLEPVTRGNALYGKNYKNMTELQTAINAIELSGDVVIGDGPGGSGGSGSSGGSGGGAWGITNSGQGEMVETIPEEKQGLKDVSKDFWAYEAITSLVEKGIINGYSDNTFKPENDITREEFITVLVKYLKLDTNKECNFADVSNKRWSYPYIAAAYSAGIITGNEINMFNPEDAITRQDMAVIVARALNMTGGSSETFADEGMISDYAIDGVKALKEAGILNGFEDNTFRPVNNSKRAEAVTIIYKISKGV